MRLFLLRYLWKGDDLLTTIQDVPCKEFSDEHRREITYTMHSGMRYYLLRHIALQAQTDIGNIFSLRVGIAIKI